MGHQLGEPLPDGQLQLADAPSGMIEAWESDSLQRLFQTDESKANAAGVKMANRVRQGLWSVGFGWRASIKVVTMETLHAEVISPCSVR